MATIRLPNNWDPREYQMPAWKAWEAGCKRLMLVWHRRAGKDDVSLHAACVAAHERVGTYWHMLPEYSQARKAIWDAVNPRTGLRRIDEAFPQETRASTRDHDMFIRLKCGSTWQVVGSDTYHNLVGTPPIGLTFSEWSKANPEAWAYLAPILVENGGWAMFITTPEGKNHAYSLLQMAQQSDDWYAQVLTIDDTGVVPSEVIEQQRLEYHAMYGVEAGDALIQQEYWCSFDAAVRGAYYASEVATVVDEGRLCEVGHDPNLLVHTAWDIGRTDNTAIWWYQVTDGAVKILDCHVSNGKSMRFYAEQITGRKLVTTDAELPAVFDGKADPVWGEVVNPARAKYKYGNQWMPHDAKAKTLAAAGRSIQQQAQKLLPGTVRIVPSLSLQDGIQAARAVFPRCWFDEEKTDSGFEALRQYRREWDDDKQCFRDRPLHTWARDPADAFRMLGIAWKKDIEIAKPTRSKFPSEMTMRQLEQWSDAQGSRRARI